MTATASPSSRGEVVEESHRLGVGPLHVVDEGDDRTVFGEVVDEPVDPVEYGARRVGGGRLRRRRARRQQRAHRAGRSAEQALTLSCGRLGDDRLEELADTAVGEVMFELARPSPEFREAGLRRHVAGGAEKARLADARWTFDEHDPSPATARLVQRLSEHGELALTFQQHCGHRLSPHLRRDVSEPVVRERDNESVSRLGHDHLQLRA